MLLLNAYVFMRKSIGFNFRCSYNLDEPQKLIDALNASLAIAND